MIHIGRHDKDVNFWHAHATINGKHFGLKYPDFKPGYYAIDLRLGRYFIVLRIGGK